MAFHHFRRRSVRNHFLAYLTYKAYRGHWLTCDLPSVTMTAWVGMGAAQIYGVLFNDKTPLWVARRTGGTWHTEYRLANAIVPGLLLPIGLGLWGAGIQYHLHFMVL